MTDKPTPTDAELKAMWQLHAADIGGIFHYARAVLAKWGTPAPVGVEPIGYLYCGGSYGDELADWEIVADQHQCDKLNEHHGSLGKEAKLPIYTTPQPTHAQAGAMPLDEVRRLFDAGWKAAALFCDREDVVADGIIGFGACPQFEAAFSAAHGITGDQHGTE